MAKQVEQLEKEKKELQERLKNQEKKVTEWDISVDNVLTRCELWTDLFISLQIDYFERAKRLEEIPLIKKAYEEQRIKDMELWELQEEDRVRFKRATNLNVGNSRLSNQYPQCNYAPFFPLL